LAISLKGSVFLAFNALTLAVLFRSLAFVFAKYAALDTIDSGPIAILYNPWYWGELGALGAQALFWIRALKHIDLTVAYPMMGMVYALNLGWSWFLFNETISVFHIVGCGIIIVGVVLGTLPIGNERE
jgi:multidrug transporter EmrE-like cation transporter